MNSSEEKTKLWVEKFIVELDICPFARDPFERDIIRYKEIPEGDEEVEFFMDELLNIQNEAPHIISSSLILLPNKLSEFEEFLGYVGACESVIEKLGLQEFFQLVPFHPEFQFKGTPKNDRSNFVNRSPYPTIHILRFEEIVMAAPTPEIGEEISLKNARMLRELSDEDFKNKVLSLL